MVNYGRKSRLSGRVLEQALRGYRGRPVNFGYQCDPNGINSPQAIARASNKRRALLMMAEAGVPTPEVYLRSDGNIKYPCVGRPDRHWGGKDFYLCNDIMEVQRAYARGCTHFMEYIGGGREFRVHVAFGKSIKIAEKTGGNSIIRNFKYGSRFIYPDFNHKKSLRRVAKQAVEVLGLDFGAVDVIHKDGRFYVLEVNTAPSLTSASDTLGRYVKAFERSAYDHNDR